MINWGIVGYGRMGKTFENCFKDPSQDFKLSAIASKSNSYQNKKIKICYYPTSEPEVNRTSTKQTC